jgi:hypothetical protein
MRDLVATRRVRVSHLQVVHPVVHSIILGHPLDHSIMPPRRSARSVTVEPEPKPNSAAAKRKRSQAPADEISAKKETKSTRLSVGPSSKGRTSTRPRASLKEVEGSDDEEDEEGVVEDSPPVKKSRPSPEIEDSEDDDDVYAEEEEVIKPKGRKSISARKGKGKASDDSDEEWDEPPKAISKGRKSASKPKQTSAPKSNGRKPKLQVNLSDEEAAVDVSGEDKSASKGRASKSGALARAHGTSEEVDDSDIEPMSMKKVSKPKLPTGRVVSSSDDGDGEKSGNNTSAALTQDEEIEESLLDPVPPPLSQMQSLSQSLPRPEEPTGPKSRLTIHKMALVNFKSYAGRQEIGPFHKVRSYTIFN